MITADTALRLTIGLTSPAAGADVYNNFLNPNAKRYSGQQGTSHTGAEWALSAGFGTTATVTVTAGSNDGRGQIQVNVSGTGQAANPTLTLTFKDGTWGTAPFAVVARNGGSQRAVTVDVTCTATTMVITFLGTPVAADTYLISWCVEG